MRRPLALALAAALALAGGACSDGDTGDAAPTETTEITVLAAASLTGAFGEIGAAFEDANPGIKVTFSFGPSDGLAAQIREGAPAQVFASASPMWMDDVADNGPGVTGRTDFARNRLTIVTPADNPASIERLDDLARSGVKLVLAAEDVPAGDYARDIFANAGIVDEALANVVSNEEDVKTVVQKVLLGEADAGIVYVTDVTPDVRPEVTQVEIPDDVNVIATYPIAVIDGAADPDVAQAFVDYVLGEGQNVLRSHGFLPATG